MVHKDLFSTDPSEASRRLLPATDTLNYANAPAYGFREGHALSQLAATGCFNNTYYAGKTDQLNEVLELAEKVAPELLAKIAVFARERGQMKDMPAVLLAVLSKRSPEHFERVFDRVIDSGKMLRNFVQVVRSGVTGRRSLGYLPKKLIRNWLEQRSDESVFLQSVGKNPSMKDIIRMVHPTPATESRSALYRHILGKEVARTALPEIVQKYLAFRNHETKEVPPVPFELLSNLQLDKEGWTGVARNANWHTTRMNLNTFNRHGVFDDPQMVELISDRLRNPELIRKVKVFPYQLLAAYQNANEIPLELREALQDAMELATQNVPAFGGNVVVCPDVSGSMCSPVTGYRRGSSSTVQCIDVAGLVSSTVLRQNPHARVLPFENHVCQIKLNPRDSVMTNSRQLAELGGGGTNCSAPLEVLNNEKAKVDLVIFVSDNESWIDASPHKGTKLLAEWESLKRRNPDAKLVCIDIQPYTTTQAPDRDDILNIGGFSDNVFEVIAAFASGTLQDGHWLSVIEKTEI